MGRPSASTAIAAAALFVALGGPATAARLIDGKDIETGTIGSKQVHDRSLKSRDLSRRAIRHLTATPNGSISASKLGPRSVMTRALAPGSVLTGTVGDNSLTASDLAPSSVAAAEVADNAIGQAEIRNNGVGASEVADQSLDSGEIIDGGLLARDIARFSGTLTVDFAALGQGECQAATATGTPADLVHADISNDLIVVAPALDGPLPLTFGTARAPARGQFRVFACNPTAAPINTPVLTLRYLIIGFG